MGIECSKAGFEDRGRIKKETTNGMIAQNEPRSQFMRRRGVNLNHSLGGEEGGRREEKHQERVRHNH